MLVVRSATVEDAERCAEIYAPFVTDSWVSFELEPPDAAEMGQRIENALHSYGWLVAEIDGTIVGYAYGSQHRSRDAYQTSCDVAVYVEPSFAGQGVGRSLYDSLFLQLKDRNLHALFAGIALPNDASIGLHQSMGFTAIGVYREVGRKLGAWRDVQWFQRLV